MPAPYLCRRLRRNALTLIGALRGAPAVGRVKLRASRQQPTPFSQVYQFARKASAFMPEMDSAGAIGVHAV
jgi:hypothetical protein